MYAISVVSVLSASDRFRAARDLLRRPSVADWVLYKLDGGIDHILVDEAQDTNPEQWEVIAATRRRVDLVRVARNAPAA